MAKDTQRRFEAELNVLRPEFRRTFLRSMADVRDANQIDLVINALGSGDVAAAVALFRVKDYLEPLRDVFAKVFGAGGNYQLDSLPKLHPVTGQRLIVRFQGRHIRAEQWLAREAGNLITRIGVGQRELIREVLARGLMEGQNPRTTALDLVGRINPATKRRSGGIIGLSDRYAKAVDKYRMNLIAQGRDSAQVSRMAGKYADRLLRSRGEAIARTETLKAMHGGRLEALGQLVDGGHVEDDAITKSWSSTGDGKVRDEHSAMDGQVVKRDEPFSSPSGALLLHPGDTSLGAGANDVANCRCWMGIDIDFLAGIQ